VDKLPLPTSDLQPLRRHIQLTRLIQMNLAYAELYIMAAAIFRKYDAYDGTGLQKGPALELYESTREDVDIATDFAVPFIKPGRKGVRVTVRD